MNKCFITGASKNIEWLLPWFVGKFNKHNAEKIPLVICDFGLSEKALSWCEKNKLNVQKVKGAKGWFFKPTALRSVDADLKVWIDVDCEVKGNISNLFNFIEEDKLSCSHDRWHSWGCKYQTGVVGVKGDPKILQDWEKRCQNPTGQYARGDQELLWDLVKDDASNMGQYIPEKYNWLRMTFHKERPAARCHYDIRCIHWTGEQGKQIITRSIREKRDTIQIVNDIAIPGPKNPKSGYGGVIAANTDGQIL